MRLEKTLEIKGYFWTPENLSKKLPGILTIKNGGKIELETVGLFYEGAEFFDVHKNPDRILGHLEDGQSVTLDNCLYISRNFSFGGISKSKIHVSKGYIGATFGEHADIEFNKISFSTDLMDEWIGISGIKIDNDFDSKSSHINYNLPKSISIKLSEELTLEICFSYRPPNLQKINEAQIYQKAFFTLKSRKPTPLTRLSKVIHKLVNFLCFATDTIVSIKELTGITENILINSKPANINIFYESIPFTERIPEQKHNNMLFKYSDIQESPEIYINGWLNTYEYLESSIDVYFATQFGAHKYLDGKFLSLAQALETLQRRTSNEKAMNDAEFDNIVSTLIDACPIKHREWLAGKMNFANEITLSQRVKKLIEPFKNKLGNNKRREKLIRKIVDTRNYLTHYNENLKNKSANGEELWEVFQIMEAILQLHFLSRIGFCTQQIDKIIENSEPLKHKLNNL